MGDSQRPLGQTPAWNGTGERLSGTDTDIRLAPGISVAEPPAGRRFLLWIDGVGGYLVCLGDEVVLGQASSEYRVDIPIQADLSRRHAKISRLGDGYVIEPWQTTRVNGQVIRGKTLLSDGDEIDLAQAVHLRFRQPHALSASARLDFVSHHRTHPKADGVLLMAESWASWDPNGRTMSCAVIGRAMSSCIVAMVTCFAGRWIRLKLTVVCATDEGKSTIIRTLAAAISPSVLRSYRERQRLHVQAGRNWTNA